MFLCSSEMLGPMTDTVTVAVLVVSAASFPPSGTKAGVPDATEVALETETTRGALVRVSSGTPVGVSRDSSISFFTDSLIPCFTLLSLAYYPSEPYVHSSLFVSFVVVGLLFQILRLFGRKRAIAKFCVGEKAVATPLFVFARVSNEIPRIQSLLYRFLQH